MTHTEQRQLFQRASGLTAQLIRNAIHPLWARQTHPNYSRYLRAFETVQFLPLEELARLQTRRLRQQLIHAYHYVPFYRLRMTQAGLTPLDIQNAGDMRLLPILTRQDVENHADMLLASNVPDRERRRALTRGTSGTRLEFYLDRERFDSRMASLDRHNGWAGLRVGDWYARLWNSGDSRGSSDRKSALSRHLLDRSLTLDTAAVTKEILLDYVALLRRYRPGYLVAQAQAAVRFADFCRAARLDDIRFRSMIVTTESLAPGQRTRLQETFGGKVFNRYACSEVGLIASECEYHTGLHVNADALLVEVEPSDDLPSGVGRVLVTDLLNRSMPLIRYDTGDLASVGSMVPCPCGRTLPLLGHVEGRATDFLHLSHNRLVSGPALTEAISGIREVRQVQFIQTDASHVTLKVVAGPGYGLRTEEELRRRLKPYLQEAISFTIVTTDSIHGGASTKHGQIATGDGLSNVASGTH